MIPTTVADRRGWRLDPAGGQVATGDRIIEMPDDFGRFEARDSHLTYTAHAPPGSVARFQSPAQGGGAGGGPACAACHGDAAAPMRAMAGGLTDGVVPAIAAFMASRPVPARRLPTR